MDVITFDFETYWDTQFSLSKISYIEYIQSAKFEAMSVSVKINDEPTVVRFGDEVGNILQSLDWSNAIAVAHNGNEFDFPLLVWKYDVHPKLFVDTLCMARPQHQSLVGVGLKHLSEHYALPAKDGSILNETRGLRYAQLSLSQMSAMARYNKIDTDNTYALYKLLKPHTPKRELLMMDSTARAIVYPKFVADTKLLADTLEEVKQDKKRQLGEMIDELGLLDEEDVRTHMASSAKFAAILEGYGVPPPMKISKKTGNPTFALAKTDEDFVALLEHDDHRVANAAAMRLGVKSTLLETRLAKMLTCAEHMNGLMSVPLGYHSATTGRWGGRVWNPQNLPRIPRDKQGNIIPKPSNALRMALRAPDGYKVVVSDLSGIELRVNHYLWAVRSSLDLYASDPEADLYKEFAAALFAIDKSEVTKDQRQLAKVAQLGLGFGAGAATFQKVAKTMGGIELDIEEAKRVTQAWRLKYADIVKGWARCQGMVVAMSQGASISPDPRGLVTCDGDTVRLPSGRKLYYPGLHAEADPESGRVQYVYGAGRNRSKLYGGLMDENLVQAIARDVIAEQSLAVRASTGEFPALMVHDELVYVIEEDRAEDFLAFLNKTMRTPPAWMNDIVLWSEGDIADSYGEAK